MIATIVWLGQARGGVEANELNQQMVQMRASEDDEVAEAFALDGLRPPFRERVEIGSEEDAV